MRTLYTLDSKGKIRVFECEIGLTGPATPTTAYTYTRTGLLGGKLIEKKEAVTKGKQKRSINQQAEFQAQSLWNEKLDEGYKSIDQLENITKCTLGDQDKEAFIKRMFLAFPNLSYTNLNGDELPMLAHKYKDVKVKNFPYYAQPKLDGVRCLVKGDRSKGRIKFISRGGQYYQIPHLEKQLGELYTFLLEAYDHTNFILDGEIYKHGVPLQEISGAARKEVGDVLFASNNWLEYWIYDIIDLNNINQSQEERITILFNSIKDVELTNIKFVHSTYITEQEGVDFFHDKYVSEGYEGLILRSPEAKYEFNQRSKGLLKVKQYQDEEFIILGSAMQTNDPETFVFILRNNINELNFKSRPTGTLVQKQEWHSNIEKYIGKKATVRFFARSNDGLPTQGIVRHKDSEILIKHIRPDGE